MNIRAICPRCKHENTNITFNKRDVVCLKCKRVFYLWTDVNVKADLNTNKFKVKFNNKYTKHTATLTKHAHNSGNLNSNKRNTHLNAETV